MEDKDELRKLELVEKELSNILDYAEQSNYETIYRIYSNIINNAELASQYIDNNDPIKKHWYKQVLQYQIKEKKYREKLQQLYFKYNDDDPRRSLEIQDQIKNQALKHIFQESQLFSPQKNNQQQWLDGKPQIVQNNQSNQQILRQMNETFQQQNYGNPNRSLQSSLIGNQPINQTANPFQTLAQSDLQRSIQGYKNISQPQQSQLQQNPLQSMNQNMPPQIQFNPYETLKAPNNQVALQNNESLMRNSQEGTFRSMNQIQSPQITLTSPDQTKNTQQYLNQNYLQPFGNNQNQVYQTHQNTPQLSEKQSTFLQQHQQTQNISKFQDQDSISSLRPATQIQLIQSNPNQNIPINQQNHTNNMSTQNQQKQPPKIEFHDLDSDLQKQIDKMKDEHQKIISNYHEEIQKLSEHKLNLEKKIEEKKVEQIKQEIQKKQDELEGSNQPSPSSHPNKSAHQRNLELNKNISDNQNIERLSPDGKFLLKKQTTSLDNQYVKMISVLTDPKITGRLDLLSQKNKKIGLYTHVKNRPWALKQQTKENLSTFNDSVTNTPKTSTIGKPPHPQRPSQSMNANPNQPTTLGMKHIPQGSGNYDIKNQLRKKLQFQSDFQKPRNGGSKDYKNLMRRSSSQKIIETKNSVNSTQLFIVEKAPALPRPYVDPLTKALADQDEISIDRFDEVMMNNCDYERIVNKEIIQRVFDVDNELINQQNIFGLVEDYYKALQPNNHTDLQLSIFGQMEVTKKLKQISNMLLQSNAYRSILNGNSSASLYAGLDEALQSMGLPNMKEFIRQQQQLLQQQVNLATQRKNYLQSLNDSEYSRQIEKEDVKLRPNQKISNLYQQNKNPQLLNNSQQNFQNTPQINNIPRFLQNHEIKEKSLKHKSHDYTQYRSQDNQPITFQLHNKGGFISSLSKPITEENSDQYSQSLIKNHRRPYTKLSNFSRNKVPKIPNFSKINEMQDEYILGSPIKQTFIFNDQSTLMNLQNNVKALNEKKYQTLPHNIKNKQFVKSMKLLTEQPNYEDIQKNNKLSILDSAKQQKLAKILDELLKDKNKRSQSQNQAPIKEVPKYYKSKEEIYRKFNFNDDSQGIERKFKQKPEIARFMEKLKQLENPLINELMIKIGEKKEKKQLKIQQIMKEAKEALKLLDQKSDKVQSQMHQQIHFDIQQSQFPSISPSFDQKLRDTLSQEDNASIQEFFQPQVDTSESISGNFESSTPGDHRSQIPKIHSQASSKTSAKKINNKSYTQVIKNKYQSDNVLIPKGFNSVKPAIKKLSKNNIHFELEIQELKSDEDRGSSHRKVSEFMNELFTGKNSQQPPLSYQKAFSSHMYALKMVESQKMPSMQTRSFLQKPYQQYSQKTSNYFETPMVSEAGNIFENKNHIVKVAISESQKTDNIRLPAGAFLADSSPYTQQKSIITQFSQGDSLESQTLNKNINEFKPSISYNKFVQGVQSQNDLNSTNNHQKNKSSILLPPLYNNGLFKGKRLLSSIQ
eukprot:403374506